MSRNRQIVWHYTNGLVIAEILRSGVIQLTSAVIGPHERPAAWFSTEPFWEPSAARAELTEAPPADTAVGQPINIRLDTIRRYSGEEMDEILGRYRIGVIATAARHGWESFKRLSGIDKGLARSMETADPATSGDVRHWRASFQPVGREHWRAVERLVSGVWLSTDGISVAGQESN